MVQTEAIVIEQTSAPSARVEGWVQYYEYFHKLSDDIQACARARACLRGERVPCIRPCALHPLTLVLADAADI
ncbi:MAG: hypothetical protein SGPRY_014676 [Prymnesium sp.]